MPARTIVAVGIAGALLAGCVAQEPDVGRGRWPNVYGADDRRDWYEASLRLSGLEDERFAAYGAETVGMFVRDRHVRLDDPDRVLLCGSNVDDYPAGQEDGCFTRTLDWSIHTDSDFGDDELAACLDERYLLQPRVGRCSGTLIDEDLVLTAGHCFDEDDDAETSVFVFNWRFEAAGAEAFYERRRTPSRSVAFWIEQPTPGLAPITRDDVYHVVRAHFVDEREERTRPSGSATTSAVRDYAIVQLDRPVALPRRPAPIDYRETHPPPGTELVVAGFPKGLPLKYDDGTRVIDSWYCDPGFNPALICNLHDGYSGGSGSGVFERGGRLVAAHRGSATDFTLDEAANCYRSRVVDDPVPDSDFPAAAHSAAWALDDFCLTARFGTDSPVCGDPALRVPAPGSCPDGAVDAPGANVCCALACGSDADCAVEGWGGGCDAEGRCRRAATCFAGEPWERDACGRPVHRIADAEACLPPGDACADAETIPAEPGRIPLSIEGLRDRDRGSCGGAYGPERVFALELDRARDVTIALDGHVLDWLLYVRRGCAPEDELFCGLSDATTDARFEGRLEAGRYLIVVDTVPNDERRGLAAGPELVLDVRDPMDAPVPDEEDGGCGCRAVGGRPGGALPLAGLLWLARRRRAVG